MRRLRFWLWMLILLAAGGALTFRFWPHRALAAGTTADAILVEKSARRLSLLKNGAVIASYSVALGRDPTGHKAQEGDGRTPEGRYTIDRRVEQSRFFRALRVSYPNDADRQHARRLGVSPGGEIMVHGIKNGFGWIGRLHRLVDWTDGCIAVTDEEMRDIWRATARGSIAVEIRP